jgi:Alpha/beta hydrolase family
MRSETRVGLDAPGRLALELGRDLAEMARGYASLSDAEARRAFLRTLRAVSDFAGQQVDATDRLYLAQMIPTLIVWGRRDPLIPVRHAAVGPSGMPGSRLEIFDGAGHFPQLEQPVRFARVLIDFIECTDPVDIEFSDRDLKMLRERMIKRGKCSKSRGNFRGPTMTSRSTVRPAANTARISASSVSRSMGAWSRTGSKGRTSSSESATAPTAPGAM